MYCDIYLKFASHVKDIILLMLKFELEKVKFFLKKVFTKKIKFSFKILIQKYFLSIDYNYFLKLNSLIQAIIFLF